jgi:hypothetical protein
MTVLWSLLGRYWPALIGLVIVLGAYQTGVNSERARGEAASLRVTIETMRRDQAIADSHLIRVAESAAELAELRRQDEEKIGALQKIVDERADRGLNQSELDGLLNIR